MSADLSNLAGAEVSATDGVNLVTGTSLVAGIGALASASCCALPLALSMLGVGSAWLVHFGVLVQNREIIAGAALVILASGWVFALRRSNAACEREGVCARPATSWIIFSVLTLTTAFVALAIGYSWWEPAVFQFLLSLRTGG